MQQLIRQTDWGDLDYLIVDLPPGTADVQQTLVRYLPLSGALVVVTPQDVAHLDARKAVQMFRRSGVPLLGGIENMSGFACPHCGELIEVFSRVPDDRSIWAMGIEPLGAIPLDPMVSHGGDTGYPILVGRPESRQSNAFRGAAQRVVERLQEGAEGSG
jgi:ATP-binding protein involved in chromosome partitioning